jgi:hypothetical protein
MSAYLPKSISHNYDSIEFIVERGLTVMSRHEVENVGVFWGFDVTYWDDIVQIFFFIHLIKK